MRYPARVLAWLALVALLAAPALAYERALTSLQVREAVFLGYSTSPRTVEFLRDYVQTFPASAGGIYLARVELATPFKQVVERTRRATSGSYSPLDAQRDYERSPKRLVLELTFLRALQTSAVMDFRPATVWGVSPADLLTDFTYWLTQRQNEVPAQVQYVNGIYDCGEFGCVLIGARVQLGLEVADVASDWLELEVGAPDDRLVRARFDLARLR